jgi:hypothetical protein
VLNTPEDSDPMTWHRYFAVQANNACWDLSTKKDRLAVDDQRMLDAAHTAFFHWAACGTEQNVQRARMLLAEVHTLVRLGDLHCVMLARCMNISLTLKHQIGKLHSRIVFLHTRPMWLEM